MATLNIGDIVTDSNGEEHRVYAFAGDLFVISDEGRLLEIDGLSIENNDENGGF